MAEYTYKDIIIDPTSEEAKNAVGKICYFSNSPRNILSDIYRNSAVEGILTNMDDGYFEVDNEGYWDCIILKKEEPKPKYVPFENAEEFIDAYDNANYSVKNGTAENKLFNYGGIWLRNKNDDSMYMVIEIWNDGVVLGSDQIATPWKYILDEYTFLDSTTCGKEVEDEADK